ncbi:MAG: hypothetical protein J5I94_29225 [Phaeodactylibacter sp.]|nr:hypothetical protein [Phaeodactylibacter sp.]
MAKSMICPSIGIAEEKVNGADCHQDEEHGFAGNVPHHPEDVAGAAGVERVLAKALLPASYLLPAEALESLVVFLFRHNLFGLFQAFFKEGLMPLKCQWLQYCQEKSLIAMISATCLLFALLITSAARTGYLGGQLVYRDAAGVELNISSLMDTE